MYTIGEKNNKDHIPVKRMVILLIICTVSQMNLWAAGRGETVVSTVPQGFKQPEVSQVADTKGIPVELNIRAGEHFMHKLKIMPFIQVKNHPQMVAWCETLEGDFISTLFITERIATQSWRSAPGDSQPKEEIRRKESLPVWSHRHGDVYADDLHLPTREESMPDAVTSATPKSGFRIETRLPEEMESIMIYFEVNNSADFNETYTKEAEPGSPAYSGGPWGSGQPALVYGTEVDLRKLQSGTPISLELLGHSSPDGSSGEIIGDLEGVTTAKEILSGIDVYAVKRN